MIAREFEAIFERFREGIIGVLCERARHLRISPGGVTFASARKMPVDPPSSAMATTADVWIPIESKVADRDRRARAAADHDRLQVVIAMRELRIDAIDRLEHGRERGLLI